jgi:hypothetical protein
LNGQEKKLFITPSLSFKTITAYDNNMQRVPLQSLSQEQEQKETVAQQQTVVKEQRGEQSVKKEQKPHLNGEQNGAAPQQAVGKEQKAEQSVKKEGKQGIGGEKKERKQRNRHKIAH